MKIIPSLKLNSSKQYYINGEFEFTMDETMVYDPNTFTPYVNISFKWSKESQQDINALQTNSEINEILADKLKQDFLKWINSL